MAKNSDQRMKKFDPSIPRRMYWSDDLPSSTDCPECGKTLKKEYQTYVVFTGEGNDAESFILGNDGGYFCSDCPVVVLDTDTFAQTLPSGDSSSLKCMVAGLVDLDAIPADKEDIPLGDEENPIPLVEFLPNKNLRRSSILKGRKIGRNDPCPCGSGKKYKKCCLKKDTVRL